MVVGLVERFAPASRPRSALLDIGCGYGHLLRRFRGRYRLAGVDLSLHAGEEAHVRTPGALVVQGDVERGLPFGPVFDVVLAINVVEHLQDPQAGVAGIASVLRPGALCVVHLPTINGSLSRLVYRLAYAGDPTHVYRPSGAEVRRLFGDAGLAPLWGSYAPHRRWLLSDRGWHPAYLAAFRREG
jgi:SAM-dependent methyltransferase